MPDSTIMDPQEDDEDNVTSRFANYEEFLDAQIQPLDMYYLEVHGQAVVQLTVLP